jgi:outer membrane protein assembly factor BamB
VADGKVYLMNFAADVVVVDAGNGTIKATIPMGERGDNMTRSMITAAHGNLFVRANNKLYCVGN